MFDFRCVARGFQPVCIQHGHDGRATYLSRRDMITYHSYLNTPEMIHRNSSRHRDIQRVLGSQHRDMHNMI